jgi:hypothetical protein
VTLSQWNVTNGNPQRHRPDVVYFAVVHDPRRQHPASLHPLEAIITMTILSTICDTQNWVEIAQ